MNHLSEKQILLWMSGEREAQMTAHVASCESCRREIGQFEKTLEAFGRSAVCWSTEQEAMQRASVPRRIRERWRYAVRWTLAGAAASVLVAVSLQQLGDKPAPSAEFVDMALLETVSAQLEQPVASPMQPLAELVDWEAVAQTVDQAQ